MPDRRRPATTCRWKVGAWRGSYLQWTRGSRLEANHYSCLMPLSGDSHPAEKRQIRQRVLAAREVLDPILEVEGAGRIAERILTLADILDARTVAAYVSVRGEPGTQAVIERLSATGVAVVLPLLRDDFDLDWAAYVPSAWRSGRFGLVEPSGAALGLDAIQQADLILCPGVAGTTSGRRLGRGGGSYDRALARARPTAFRSLLLYDDEVLEDVPAEPHDQYIDALVTPGALIRVTPPRPDQS